MGKAFTIFFPCRFCKIHCAGVVRRFGGDIELRTTVLGNEFVSLTGDGKVEKSRNETME